MNEIRVQKKIHEKKWLVKWWGGTKNELVNVLTEKKYFFFIECSQNIAYHRSHTFNRCDMLLCSLRTDWKKVPESYHQKTINHVTKDDWNDIRKQ